MKHCIEKTSCWLVAGALSLLPLSSNATLIATEHFDYPDSNSLVSVGTGGSGWSGGWTTNGTSFEVVDGAAYTGDQDAFVNFRTLAESQSTGTLYFAWTGVKERTVDLFETQVLALSGFSNNNSTEEFSLQFRTSNATNEFFLLYGGADSTTGSDSGGSYTEGTEVTFVLEIDFNPGGDDNISAWVFTDGLPAILDTPLLTNSAPITSIDSIRIISNGKRMTGALDNIVVATEYSDLINAVPEPSTYAALFGICTLTVVIIRRRRLSGRDPVK
ncbi:PEP-CTERM sorting domain-containing protein [Cerasicoccus maritimus]|uniref:PEP-CTERM sorting domain-containing protein n=1 Tax=Cerasicoccus maritimus TaxID=490089 RepID=UPI002852AE3A|nr:PEP-CTERM sorting domain-containing protein [Cerasicoccus maritimus]